MLESWVQTTNNAEDFIIAGYYSQEGIACMIPEDNSQLLNNVNYALVRFMQNFLAGKQESVVVFDRWFGSQGHKGLVSLLPIKILSARFYPFQIRDFVIENHQCHRILI